jgi:hypothetical protein
MTLVSNLPKALGKTSRKLFVGTASITGTGGIATGLGTIDAGSPQVTVQNSATAIPTNIATVSSIAAGTVNIVVVALAAAANTISAVAATVGLSCTGY